MNINPDALAQFDAEDEEDIYAGLPWNHCARFDGIPGMVWYSDVRKVRGDQLRIGDWLDTLDHHGARCIYGMWVGEVHPDDLSETMVQTDAPGPDAPLRTVMFGCGDTETIRADVEYDVVDPASQVTPDGTPVVVDPPPDKTGAREEMEQ